MAENIAVLLADSDALRREGMAAVIQGAGSFQIVAQCADGISARDSIRILRPEVAVVDLNLPKLHGIEVVRQVRAGSPELKVIVVSGSEDDEVIREVVRAGADGYLLKNAPPRHLLDAIRYVRDGGQYFSPHLRRDGLDRRYLEEQPHAGQTQTGSRDQIRERLREELEAERATRLPDREHEILSLLAEGIRPILDRLDDIEGRVNGMKRGLEPVPGDPRGWISSQLEESYSGGGNARVAQIGRSVRELEARLPELIEATVAKRFHSMADKLQREIEETHIKTLESFVKNIQIKLVHRVSALEKDISIQAEGMKQLRECSQRTEENLSRLISGVDRLAQEFPKRLQEPRAFQPPDAEPEIPSGPSFSGEVPEEKRFPGKPWSEKFPPQTYSSERYSSPANAKFKALGVLLALILGFAGVWEGTKFLVTRRTKNPAASAVPGETHQPMVPEPGAATKSKLEAADEFARRKEYPTAENLYRQIVQSEPKNVDALKGLASVLYRQDKIEESAAILDRIPAQ